VSAIERKPLTAYQRRIRKELGHEDEEPTLDQQLSRLEVDIRRLKVEFDIFFNGGVKHPPYDTRNRIETTMARLSDDRTLTFAQRYKFNSLSARFAAFRDLWRRSMQSREEGRDFITIARAKLEAMRREADAEIAARNAAKREIINVPAESVSSVIPSPTPREPAAVELKQPVPLAPAIAQKRERAVERETSAPRTELVKGSSEPEAVSDPMAVESVEFEATGPIEEIAAPVDLGEPQVATDEMIDFGREDSRVNESFDTAETADRASGLGQTEAVDFAQTHGTFVEMETVDEPVAPELHAVVARVTETEESAQPTENLRGLKPNRSSFPKILPPSAHQPAEPEQPTRDRRAGDRRSGDRRALPFGRRANDPKPVRAVDNDVMPIVAPPEADSIRTPEPTREMAAVEFTVPETISEQVPEIEAPEVRSEPVPEPAAETRSESMPSGATELDAIASFVFTDPRRDMKQVKALITAMAKAKEKCGEPAEDLLPSRYGPMLASRADKIRKKSGCSRVMFTIVTKNGKVELEATAAE
jgi:hypothetical protein